MAKVSVKIGSKFDKQGVEAARKGVKGLADDAEKSGKRASQSFVNLAAKIYVAAKALGAVKRVFTEFVDLYGVQEDAERKLARAAGNNPYLNGDGARRLAEYASEMQAVSRFGDETIIAQQSFIAALGYTEDQIKDVTLAAVELASTGQIGLEAAFRGLQQTMGGTGGTLGRIIPELRNLSTEALQAGEGVQFIIEQFSGMKEASIEGVQGLRIQIQNTVGDIKEDIAEIFIAMFEGGEGGAGLKQVFDNVAQWFEANQGKFYAIFSNIPTIAQTAFDIVLMSAKKIFDPTNFVHVFQAFSGALYKTIDLALSAAPAIWSDVLDIMKITWETFGKTALDNFWEDFKFMFASLPAQLKRLWQGEALGARPEEQAGPRQLDTFMGAYTGLGEDTPGQAAEKALEEYFAVVGQKGKSAATAIFNAVDEAITGEGGFADAVKTAGDIIDDPDLKAAIENLNAVLKASEVEFEEFKASTMEAADAVDEMAAAMSRPPGDYQFTEGPEGEAGGAAYEGGETLGAIIKAAIGDPTELAMRALVLLASKIESVAALLDGLDVLISSLADTLGPVIDSILKPVIGIIVLLGQTIGQLLQPLLEAIAPVISDVIDAFIFLWNQAVKPVGNLLWTLGQTISWVIDSFRTAMHNLGEIMAHPFRASQRDMWTGSTLTGFLAEKGGPPLGDITRAELESYGDLGLDSQTGGGIHGGSTSVIQAPDIYVTNHFDGVFIGAGGIEQVGEYMNDALTEFVNGGGTPVFVEA